MAIQIVRWSRPVDSGRLKSDLVPPQCLTLTILNSVSDEIMSDQRSALTHWNPGMKRGIITMMFLMVGLKIVDTLVQDNGILAPSWKWTLIAGLCGGVYASVVNAYQAGLDSDRKGTSEEA